MKRHQLFRIPISLSSLLLLFNLQASADANKRHVSPSNMAGLAHQTSMHINGSDLMGQSSELYFLENKGQITDQYGKPRKDIDFKIAGNGVTAFIGDAQMHYQWSKTDHIDKENAQVTTYRMDVALVGANKKAKVVTEDKQAYYERYYVSQCGDNGTTTEAYKKITYKEVYPNIDWVLYVKNDKVEYDFVVRPGGRVADIKMKYGGATSLHKNEDGSITATTPMGSIKENTPYSFAALNGKNVAVASRFVVKNDVVSFNTASSTGTLVIDPTLEWATYYGGTGYDVAFVKCDQFNNVYLFGQTGSSTNIATTGSYQSTYGGGSGIFGGEGFLIKFNTLGVRQWGTYYGGALADAINTGDIDALGNIYIGGSTKSTANIAIGSAHQAIYGGGAYDGFLAKFDAAGSRLWGTYYGGAGIDEINAVACDVLGNVYITGNTNSITSIATTSSFQSTKVGTVNDDVFVAKFNSIGVRQWGTYYGGNGNDRPNAITDDINGDIYIAGTTDSDTGIATLGSHQDTLAVSSGGDIDMFLVKFDASGTRKWGTYYGGNQSESPGGIVSDNQSNIYIAGSTRSDSGISTPNSWKDTIDIDPVAGYGIDAFLVKFNDVGARQWGSYYGGIGYEVSATIFASLGGDIYMLGGTNSTMHIATLGSYQSSYGGGSFTNTAGMEYFGDGFIARFSSTGNLISGSYYGATGDEAVTNFTNDNLGNIYIAGGTNSITGLATAGSHQPVYGGGFYDAFLTKLCTVALPPSEINGDDSLCANTTAVYSVPKVSNAKYIWHLPSGWSGNSDSSSINVTAGTTGGVISLEVINCNDTSTAQTLNVVVSPIVPATITVNGFVLGTANTHSSYQWYKDGQLIPGATNPTYTVIQNGNYTVKVTNPGGCSDSDTYLVTNVAVSSVQNVAKAITVYPNPAHGNVHIMSPIAVNAIINSIDGKQVMYTKNATDIDISSLAEGVYILRITDAVGALLKTEKLVKVSH